MPLGKDIEDELRDYLRAQRDADIVGTLRHITNQLNQHEKDDERRHGDLHGEIRGLSLRVGALERSDEKIEDRLEKSGSWEREALQAQLASKRDDLNWIRRNWLSVTIAFAALLASVVGLFKK